VKLLLLRLLLRMLLLQITPQRDDC